MKRLHFTPFQIFVHLAALVPLGLMIYLWLTGGLTANPVQDLTLRTGKAALWLLILSLAATPAYSLAGFKPALKVRRALGLFAFFYASLHLLCFIWLDYGLDFALMLQDVGSKRYVFAGLSAFLLLLPLALTSTRGWMKRLGKNWKRLHRLVYLAGTLAVVHYVWLVKADLREPLAFATALGLLLLARVPAVRRPVSNFRLRLESRLRRPRISQSP
jgi:sulfoxide reductase heme-binding subunit YedZ